MADVATHIRSDSALQPREQPPDGENNSKRNDAPDIESTIRQQNDRLNAVFLEVRNLVRCVMNFAVKVKIIIDLDCEVIVLHIHRTIQT